MENETAICVCGARGGTGSAGRPDAAAPGVIPRPRALVDLVNGPPAGQSAQDVALVAARPTLPTEVSLLRPQEVADALAISLTRVYELFKSGRLRSVRIDRSRRVWPPDLVEFIKASRDVPVAD